MTHPYATLTRNEHCLAALDRAFAEHHVAGRDRYPFAVGFVAGWQERGVDDHARGWISLTREQHADLERRAGLR